MPTQAFILDKGASHVYKPTTLWHHMLIERQTARVRVLTENATHATQSSWSKQEITNAVLHVAAGCDMEPFAKRR
jgi:hypothetical protein